MALAYADSALLMKDPGFVDRIKVSCLHYAAYIVNEPNNVPAHNTRVRWAQNAFNSPDVTAANLAPSVVMDPAVQDIGSAITDAALQSAVENTVNQVM